MIPIGDPGTGPREDILFQLPLLATSLVILLSILKNQGAIAFYVTSLHEICSNSFLVSFDEGF